MPVHGCAQSPTPKRHCHNVNLCDAPGSKVIGWLGGVGIAQGWAAQVQIVRILLAGGAAHTCSASSTCARQRALPCHARVALRRPSLWSR
eukprot:2612896-Prymnesium_polylepis.2